MEEIERELCRLIAQQDEIRAKYGIECASYDMLADEIADLLERKRLHEVGLVKVQLLLSFLSNQTETQQ